MKICVTGLRGIPGVIGGVETHCEELLPRLAQSNPDIEIELCCRSRYVDAALTSFRGVRLSSLYAPTGNASEALVSTLVSVVHARMHGADAIHIHAVGPALLAPVARLLGLKVLLTHHGADYDRAKWGLMAKGMLRAGEWLGMRLAHRIICVSPSLTDTMRRRFPAAAARTVFIPNGVSPPPTPDKPAGQILDELGLEAGRFILCAARLVPEKGIDYLIDAHRHSGDQRILAIAGSGKKNDRYAQDLIAKAGGNVKMLGMLPRSVLGVLYRNASLFVLPSFHEGLPIAALEALSCQCPVLLSDIQPNRDLDLPADCYFPVGDTDTLARRLAQAPAHANGSAAPAAVLMSWDEVSARTAIHYRALLERRSFMAELSNAG